jgi:hypothetical protein
VIGFKIITELSSPEDSPYLESDKLSNRHRIITLSTRLANFILTAIIIIDPLIAAEARHENARTFR